MDLAFDEDQQALRRMAQRFLGQRAGSAQLRRSLRDGAYDPQLWQAMGSELGWTGLRIPESRGGLGLGPVELVAVMEPMGHALVASPFFASTCLALPALLALGDHPGASRWLPGLASAELAATLALHGKVTARRSGADFVLDGSVPQVLDGSTAQLLLVVTQLDAQPALFACSGGLPGLRWDGRATLDPTRPQACLTFSAVKLRADALLAHGAAAQRVLDHALRLARIALAAEQVGGAQRCLDMAVEYAGTRHQFGRPIGSFQAIKHLCADMLVQVETARSAVYYAAAAAQCEDPGLEELARLASACCAEAFFFCAAQNIQIHGGIGFTWEHDAHLYFKRARGGLTLLGSPDEHREWLAERLLDG